MSSNSIIWTPMCPMDPMYPMWCFIAPFPLSVIHRLDATTSPPPTSILYQSSQRVICDADRGVENKTVILFQLVVESSSQLHDSCPYFRKMCSHIKPEEIAGALHATRHAIIVTLVSRYN